MNKNISLLVFAAGLAGMATSASAEPVAAAENWRKHCQRCHAADGSGSTRIGQRLKLKDYTSAAVQAELTDAEILAATRDGVKDAGGKETMPGYTDKMSAEEIQALVAHIRAMKKD
jgi:cytochrome c553